MQGPCGALAVTVAVEEDACDRGGMVDFGVMLGFDPGAVPYPSWRLVYFLFSLLVIGCVFAFLQFTTYGMVVRAGMADRETVGLLGIDIDRRFTLMFGLAAAVAGLAGVMYTPILSPDYHLGMDFLVLSFVVVVVGGMGSLPGAVAAGFLLGILQSFASMNEVKSILPGIDQIIIYLVAVVILLGLSVWNAWSWAVFWPVLLAICWSLFISLFAFVTIVYSYRAGADG